MDNESKSRIQKLNEALYSRTRYHDPQDKRTPVKELDDAPEVGESWQTPALDEMLKHERIVEPLNPFMKRLFIFALIFFIGTAAIAGYIFMGGATFISSRNVDVNVLGPTSVSAGATLELGITISNTNNADLEVANLSIQYPQGARNPDNTAEALTFTKEELGEIGAGDEVIRNVRVVLLGAALDVKEIKFSVEYKVKGSNATFYKDKIYEVTIGDAPITLSVQSPNAISSGGEFTTQVSVTLNATDVLRNVVLKAEYPYGYTVTSANPVAADDNNIWALGDLSPGEKKIVNIRGRLVGENEDERTFRFYIGVSETASAPNLKIPITSLLNTVAIDRPSIGLNINFNGENTNTYIAPAARTITTNIRFQNNLADKLLNPRLELTFNGAALDKNSVRASNNGTFDQSNSKLTWDLQSIAGSRELAPGASGQVTVSFSSLPATSLTSGNNDIVLNFNVTGVPIGAVGQGVVSASESRIVRISSQVNLSAKALRTLGPYANHGPLPPKVGEETTYSIILNLGNTQNDITEAKLTAKLGVGVTWLGAPSSSGENVTFDSQSGTLTWDIGTLSSGAGFATPAEELAFQVALKPILGQVGSAPILVNNITLTGRDSAGGGNVSVSASPVTTRLSSDPAFIQGDDIVQK